LTEFKSRRKARRYVVEVEVEGDEREPEKEAGGAKTALEIQ
jgi:hypothetical protein